MKRPANNKALSALRQAWTTLICIAVAMPAVAASMLGPRPGIDVPDTIVSAILQGEDISRDTRGNAAGFVALVEGDDVNGGGVFRCVGAAVAIDVVVTAGHCLRDIRNLRVQFLSSLSPLAYETIPARDYRAHPMMNKGDRGEMYENFTEDNAYEYHDIGVILLDFPSNQVVPVTLTPTDFSAEAVEDPNFFVFGRGRNFKNRAYKGNIEFARILRPEPMRSGPNYYKATLDTAAEAPQAVCVADSGGPVTVAARDEYIVDRNVHYLMGIFAFQVRPMRPADVRAASKHFGSEAAIPQCGMGMGYVNIHAELTWIERTLAEMDPANPRRLMVFGRD